MHGSGRPAGQTPDTGPQLSHHIDSFTSYDSLDAYQLTAIQEHDNEQPDEHLDGRQPEHKQGAAPTTVAVGSSSSSNQSYHAASTTSASGVSYNNVPPPATLLGGLQQPLRSQGSAASLSSVSSLVFDPTINAYTRVPGNVATATPKTAAPSAKVRAFTPMEYAPPPAQPTSGLARQLSHMFPRRQPSSRRRGGPGHVPIREEDPSDGARGSIDMTSLVHNAAPVGISPSIPFGHGPYARVPGQEDQGAEDDRGVGGGPVAVDYSSFLGRETRHDDAFVRGLHEQEAGGTLTLGLGSGFSPGAKIREADLLAMASTSPDPAAAGSAGIGSLRRSLSRRWTGESPITAASPSTYMAPWASSFAMSPTSPLTRRDTVRALAQSEANRRGEIVEVILEEDEAGAESSGPSQVDLSVVSGPVSLRSSATMATQKSSQVFYPQPDWRPFSMRWPYLVFLILLSAGLGVAQEFIYRQSASKPLVVFTKPTDIPGSQYFAFKFAPTLIAVMFGVLWQVTDFEVKRMEAFYQLSREEGAVADESINVDYVSSVTFLQPFRALYCKHYAVAISAVATLLAVSLVPTLASVSLVLHPDRAQRKAEPLGEKQVVIHPVFSRVLSGAFGLIAVLGCALFVLLQRRRSGLASDVKGIAGLASMAVVSHIMNDFRDMDVATHNDIHAKLKDRRYVLRNASIAPDDNYDYHAAAMATRQERERFRAFGRHLSQNPHPLLLRRRGGIAYIVCVLAFAGLVPLVLFTPANVLTDRAPWVLTALAIGIRLGWGALETSVRMMEPYYLLSLRHAPAKTLTLDYAATPFIWVALQALRNGHLLVFCVGFGTVMTEVLTVLVSSLATAEGHGWAHMVTNNDNENNPTMDGGEETLVSFMLSLGLTAFILLYMCVVAGVVLWRRGRPFLPRQPNTISSVLAFIHQSKLLWNFVGTSKMNSAQVLTRLEELGQTYGLGWFEGRDGQTHCGIDQEELLSSYKLGYDYSRSNKPWNEAIDWL